MKKTLPLLTSVLVLALGSSVARAQDYYVQRAPTDRVNVIVFDPGDLIDGILTLEYERALSPSFGITFGLSATAFRGAFTPNQDASVVAFGPEVGVRFHFIQNAPAGLWVGPSLDFGYVVTGPNGTVAQAYAYGLGGAVGYNFVIARNFVFQVGAGRRFEDYGYGAVWEPRLLLGLGGAF